MPSLCLVESKFPHLVTAPSQPELPSTTRMEQNAILHLGMDLCLNSQLSESPQGHNQPCGTRACYPKADSFFSFTISSVKNSTVLQSFVLGAYSSCFII